MLVAFESEGEDLAVRSPHRALNAQCVVTPADLVAIWTATQGDCDLAAIESHDLILAGGKKMMSLVK